MGKIKTRFLKEDRNTQNWVTLTRELSEIALEIDQDASRVVSLQDTRRLLRPMKPRRSWKSLLGELAAPIFDRADDKKGMTVDRMKRLLDQQGYAPAPANSSSATSYVFDCTFSEGNGPFTVMLLGKQDNGTYRSLAFFTVYAGRDYALAESNRINREVWCLKFYLGDSKHIVSSMELSAVELSDPGIIDNLDNWFVCNIMALENLHGGSH